MIDIESNLVNKHVEIESESYTIVSDQIFHVNPTPLNL
jgi:hypothetical protein